MEKGYLTKDEATAMDPDEKTPAKFYSIFKVHKEHQAPKTPPLRPIISGSGSITENLGVFVEHHIKETSTKHKSYLQDTPHLLRVLDKINRGPKLPPNTILATVDIISAYQNIPQDDGIQCLEEALENRQIKEVPSEYLAKVMDLIQRHNIFEFHENLYKQLIGCAMGIHPAPSYANTYLARRIDVKIEDLARKYEQSGQGSLKMFKRFLDDILKLFIGSTKNLHKFFDEMNELHPTLKFTMIHTTLNGESEEEKCRCENRNSIPYLDTQISIENGKLEIDLYKKPTDRNQYLLPSSCHPKETTKNLPFSCALRIVRICTKNGQRDLRLNELKQLLIRRQYNEALIDRAIEKAQKIPRKYAIKKVNRKSSNKRPVFATKFDPRLPNIPNIQSKHWRSMKISDQHLAEIFPEPPMTGFRKQRNLQSFLIKSKVPKAPDKYQKRQLNGMMKCGNSCPTCPFIKEGKEVNLNNNSKWKINGKFTCETSNCIYMIECKQDKCKQPYIGQTKTTEEKNSRP